MTALWLLLIACNDGGVDTQDTDTDTEVGSETDTDAPTDRWEDVREALQAELEASRAPAVSIAVYENGEVVWAEAYGTTVAGGDVPVTTDTLFQASVVTNVFTGMALLQGVEAGYYDLSDDLVTLLPDLQSRPADLALWQQTTAHHLLTQQTGLFDFIEWDEDPANTLAAVSLVQYPSYSPFDNPPGRFFNFSYVNNSYAGLVRQTHDTRDYADIMRQDVFVPLGMARTTQSRDAVAVDGDYALGSGYLYDDEGTAQELDVQDLSEVPHPPFSRPAGTSTWTTPSELTRVADFLIHGNEDILSDELREQITTSHTPLLSTPDASGYGYGMYIRPGVPLSSGYRPTTAWEHSGHTLQYTSALYILPELDYAVAILSSGHDTDFSFSMQEALELAPGLPEPVEDPTYTIDPDRFPDHVGYYDGPPNIGDLIIEEQDGGLAWTLPAYDAAGLPYDHTLETLSSTVFVGTANGQRYGLTFIGEEGSPSEFVRNRFFVGVRSEAPQSILPRHWGDVGLPPIRSGPAPMFTR